MHRRARRVPLRPGHIQRGRDRAAALVRRPGRDRDRERAAVQRDQGGARAADGHRRRAARDQRLGRRHEAGVRRRSCESCRALFNVTRDRHHAGRRHGMLDAGRLPRRRARRGRRAFPAPSSARRPGRRSASAACCTTRACSAMRDVPHALQRICRAGRRLLASPWRRCCWEERAIGAHAVVRQPVGAVQRQGARSCSRPSPTRP